MSLKGAAVIAKGTMTSPVTITATDPSLNDGFSDTLDNFDIIGVNYEDRVTLAPGRVRLRRQGQGSMDTSYITYELHNTAETFNAANTYLETSGRIVGNTAILHNVGLAAPVTMFSGDIATAFGFTTYGIHNSVEVCDAIEISAASYGPDGIPYTVWGIYKGLSDVIKTVDLSADVGAGSLLVTTSDAGYPLDKYELVRVTTIGMAPNTGILLAQVREKGGSLIGVDEYEFARFQLALENTATDQDGHWASAATYGQLLMRGLGLPSQTFGQWAYYGAGNDETVGQSTAVASATVHDALSIYGNVTMTGGTTYLTGIRKK